MLRKFLFSNGLCHELSGLQNREQENYGKRQEESYRKRPIARDPLQESHGKEKQKSRARLFFLSSQRGEFVVKQKN